MKPSDFARKGSKYRDRTDVLFDKALSRNNKVNSFKTEQCIVEIGGFEITRQTKTAKKTIKTSNYFDFADMRGASGVARMNAAKRAFNSLMLAGLRGQNHIEFTCNVNNARNRDIYLDLGDFEKTEEFGGRGPNSTKQNFGTEYEKSLAKSLQDWKEGLPVKRWADHVKTITTEVQKKHGAILEVIVTGEVDTKRPLVLNGKNVVISVGGGTLTTDIGSKVADIVLRCENSDAYLSVKYGDTLSFFNCGVAGSGKANLKLFPETDLRKGEIPDDGKKYLDMFGIVHEDFLSVFEKYTGKDAVSASVKNHIRKISLTSSQKSALENLIASGVGKGYWMTHYDGGKLHFHEINNKYLTDASTLTGSTIELQYGGGNGKAKRINMVFETKTYEFSFNIRSKSGGIYPTHTNGDYFKKN
jgi:hypothetical protein